jgi:hypothetical protein
MKFKAILWASLALNVILLTLGVYIITVKKYPYPYCYAYMGKNFSNCWNDGKKLKEFLIPNKGKIVSLSFWIDTEDVMVEMDNNRFRFSASMSETDPNDYSDSDGICIATTQLPNRFNNLNIYREGKYLSISGLFSVSDITDGRQGIKNIIHLTPE